MIPILRDATDDEPGVIPIINQASLFEKGLSGGRTIDIEISGDGLDKLLVLGKQVMDQVSDMFPLDSTGTFIRPRPSLELASPELHIRRNLEKAAQRGVNTSDLGYTLNALIDGAYAGDFWHHGYKIDLVITAPRDLSSRTQDVGQLQISTPTGESAPLASVADITSGTGPERIVRIDRQRAVTIQVKPGKGIALEDAIGRINAEVIAPLRAAAPWKAAATTSSWPARPMNSSRCNRPWAAACCWPW